MASDRRTANLRHVRAQVARRCPGAEAHISLQRR